MTPASASVVTLPHRNGKYVSVFGVGAAKQGVPVVALAQDRRFRESYNFGLTAVFALRQLAVYKIKTNLVRRLLNCREAAKPARFERIILVRRFRSVFRYFCAGTSLRPLTYWPVYRTTYNHAAVHDHCAPGRRINW